MAKRGRPLKNYQPPDTDLPELLSLWNLALASPTGIAIASEKPDTLAQKLYAARRECGHFDYVHLKVVQTETEVWICPR